MVRAVGGGRRLYHYAFFNIIVEFYSFLFQDLFSRFDKPLKKIQIALIRNHRIKQT